MKLTTRVRVVLTLCVALLILVAFAGTALAATPANDGAGQAYGQAHATCAQAGHLGGSANPGMHRGITGWTGDCPTQ